MNALIARWCVPWLLCMCTHGFPVLLSSPELLPSRWAPPPPPQSFAPRHMFPSLSPVWYHPHFAGQHQGVCVWLVSGCTLLSSTYSPHITNIDSNRVIGTYKEPGCKTRVNDWVILFCFVFCMCLCVQRGMWEDKNDKARPCIFPQKPNLTAHILLYLLTQAN